MPEIARFLGIVISMYVEDHAPPHFHARYGEHKASFAIKKLEVLDGKMPPRITALIIEWAMIHQKELLKEWELVEAGEPLFKIDPLV